MLLNYHIGRFVLGSLCVGDLVRLVVTVLQVSACNPDTNHTKSAKCSLFLTEQGLRKRST